MTKLLSLLQICDSNFPSGAFSHSFGLETYISEQKVYDAETFSHLLEAYMRTQIAYTDGLACRIAYERVQNRQIDALWELDTILSSLMLARETREGNRRIGAQMVKLFCNLYESELLQQYKDRIRKKELSGHSAIAFAIVCSEIGIDRNETLASYLFSSIQSLIQNGVRAIPLGQTDGQRLLLRMQPIMEEIAGQIEMSSEEELGQSAPGLEIAQMRHEQLSVRLFMS